MLELDEAFAAAPGLHGEAAPEREAAVDLERLAAVAGLEADALLLHPDHGGEAVADQEVDEVGVGPVLGDAGHVVEVLLGAVGAEVDVGALVLGEIGHELDEVVDAVEHDAHGAGGVAGVAAALRRRCRLDHEHRGALLPGGEGGAGGGVAGADHDDVDGLERLGWLAPHGCEP
ncbi:MAG: hypothetical protein R2749_03140 [Acidimicrobiales bacterium]